ncbi:hypothetical protein [Bacillus cereus]|uniref:hypothetical protein n=1 Tax=Bacillus cereus TaxID=1396 RepID=UPI002D780358|nr:hypothetical protein [Bacillus cereus]
MPISEKIVISKTARDLFVNRNNRALLIYSQHPKEKFQILFKLAKIHLNSNAREIDKVFETLQRKEILLLNEMLGNVINICRNEWIGDVDPYAIIENEKERKTCSLCKQKNNKLVFHIKNKFNGRRINVGSSCINDFSSLEYPSGVSKKEVMRSANQKYRLQNLIFMFPGIEGIVGNWEKELEMYEILFPHKIEQEYLETGKKLKNLYNNYINGKVNKIDAGTIKKYLTDRKEFLAKMSKYEELNKNQDFVVTRKMVNWLQRRRDFKTIEILKIKGYITKESAYKVLEPNFIESFIPKFNRHFQKNNMQIVSYNKEYSYFKIKPFYNLNFYLKISCYKLIRTFSSLLFDNKPNIAPSLKNIFQTAELFSEVEQEIVINELNRIKSNVTMKLLHFGYAYDHFEYNELDLFDKRINKFIVVKMNKFLEEFKGVAFGLMHPEEIEKYVDYELSGNSKAYTHEELWAIRDRRDDTTEEN